MRTRTSSSSKMTSLRQLLVVLTVTAGLTSSQDSGYNLTDLIEEERLTPEDNCAEDEWRCHDNGEAMSR